MTPERWSRAKTLFGQAIALEPARREAFVRKAAAGDEALYAEVVALLRADSTDTALVNPLAAAKPLLKGRYQEEKEMGRGGLGVVYLARDQALHGRSVVVKMPIDRGSDDPWLKRKFAEEVRALALIDHPGVVGALDSGTTPEGRPFLVMQYVEGEPLTIPAEGVPLDRAARLLRQIGQALAAAHAKGVWHRDLKPANIMLRRLEDGEHARLIDFGIASVREALGGDASTRAAGTPPYMAPEQLRGRASQVSDIWAMGVLAYELVGGRRPFLADNVIHLQEMQRAGPPLRPAQLRPGLPQAAERLILQALSFRPQDRPQDANVFGEALAAALLETPAQEKPSRPRGDLRPMGF